jgi:hypothetical protein
MKKIFSFLCVSFIGTTSFAQAICFNSFDVLNNGNGPGIGCSSSTFPGYLSQPADASFQRSGKVELRFSSPLPSGVNPPEITRIRKILTASPTTYSADLAFKFSFLAFTGTGRTETEYCYYGNSDLDNGSGSRYEIEVKYDATGGNTTSTCVITQAPDPITLPVRFSTFSVNRSSDTRVSITWTTATEQNSKGFYIQKNVNGEWKDIAFVFSQTEDGNSTSALTYSFNDTNTDKGISQYRIQQVDMDGKASYSDIRAIRNEAITSKVTVYPNPTTNGKLNVVFEDNNGLRDVIVNDMQGKMIKSFKNIANNILVIDKLSAGFYTIKITNRSTNASLVQKVMVKS